MELNKPFSVPAVLGAETSAAEDENHWMLSLQFGELPMFRGVIGKLIVGEDRPGNNVRSHIQPPFLLEYDHSQRQEPTKTFYRLQGKKVVVRMVGAERFRSLVGVDCGDGTQRCKGAIDPHFAGVFEPAVS
jgi:hypothetical protein